MDGSVIHITNSLDLSSIPANSPLHKILGKALDDWDIPRRKSAEVSDFYWDAPVFNLDRSLIFRQLKREQQQQILHLCSRAILEEASFVEKSATCFTAKMTLLSERTEERMLYSLFAAEEVAHYAAVTTYLPGNALPEPNPFIRLLSRVLEEGDRSALTFVIQVVLEGWGLTHFASLAENCIAEDLRETLNWFVRHEARHHGSGVVLFNETPPSSAQVNYIVEVMIELLRMIQIGPQTVLTSMMRVTGELTRGDLIATCGEIEAALVTRGKLQKLKSLMKGEHSSGIVEKLEKYGAFDPSPAPECVNALRDWNG